MKLALLFPLHLRDVMQVLDAMTDLEEIRVRVGQPLVLYTQRAELWVMVRKGDYLLKSPNQIAEKDEIYRMTEKDLLEMQNYISNYSLYAYKDELRNGFITIQGGHRIGLAGTVSNKDGKINGISYLSFLNIRVAHEKKGCAKSLLSYLRHGADIYNTLLVSPPGTGKTTLLRDCIRSFSYGEYGIAGKKIAIVDERSEIAASFHGVPQNDVGPRTDVLDGCNKPEGIMMLLRTMSPEVIAVDELGIEEDYKAIEQAAYSGCRIIGTVHAGSVKDLQEKPNLQKWCQMSLFERFVFIEKGEDGIRNFHVYNSKWERLC